MLYARRQETGPTTPDGLAAVPTQARPVAGDAQTPGEEEPFLVVNYDRASNW